MLWGYDTMIIVILYYIYIYIYATRKLNPIQLYKKNQITSSDSLLNHTHTSNNFINEYKCHIYSNVRAHTHAHTLSLVNVQGRQNKH